MSLDGQSEATGQSCVWTGYETCLCFCRVGYGFPSAPQSPPAAQKISQLAASHACCWKVGMTSQDCAEHVEFLEGWNEEEGV